MLNARMPKRDEVAQLGRLEEELRLRLAMQAAGAASFDWDITSGAIHWDGGIFNRRPHTLAPYEPGPGRIPAFPHALLCPSILAGIELERLPDIQGLPAFAAPPPLTEPWIYDGRIVLNAKPGSRT